MPDIREHEQTDTVALLATLQETDPTLLSIGTAHQLRRDLERFERRQPDAEQLQRIAAAVERSAAQVARHRAHVFNSVVPAELPIAALAERIQSAIVQHPVTIVCGATGSGKTTQLPRICLRAGLGVRGMIGHTQPRRLAARSVAERIADELGTPLGEGVGYRVRFADRTGPQCRVKLMTDGILLQELRRDRWLRRYDCLIIDEAHERSLNIDFMLGYLRRVLAKRDDLKVIITSATIDTQRFADFFAGAPVLEVGGRGFPVDIRYAGASDADPTQQVSDSVMDLCREGDGDTLVFLPGEREIKQTAKELTRRGIDRFAEVLPLYARLRVDKQQRIFKPGSRRRVILATNIAETSLTVPRIKYVVDSGLARIARYSYRSKLQRLPIEKISQASAQQRSGRCGRLGPGVAIRLYDADDFAARDAFTEPEIRRTNLASVILRMALLELGDVESFTFVDAPDPRFISDGYRLLRELNAFDDDGKITKTGRRMAALPVDPRLARVIVAAAELGCLCEVLIIASGLSVPDPRQRPEKMTAGAEQRQAEFADSRSDFLALLNVWQRYQALGKRSGEQWRWCKKHFISRERMNEWQDVHTQLVNLTTEQGMVSNARAASFAVIHRALLTGFIGHIGERDDGRQYRGARQQSFIASPGSALAAKPPVWVVAAELIDTTRVYAHTLAAVKPAWIREAGSHLIKTEYHDPRWSQQRGQVTAIERVTLFGLTLVSGRRVNYGRHDPVQARSIFIDSVLVDPQDIGDAPYAQHNAALREQCRQAEARVRRTLAATQRQRAFFMARLPANVYDMRSLSTWLDAQNEQAPDCLFMTLDDVGDSADSGTAWYPQHLRIADNDMPLDYVFAPGSDADGVTLRLPVALAGHVSQAQLDWLIPGWLEGKVLAIFRGLPKAQRKLFAPLPQSAREFLAWAIENDLPGNREGLSGALTRFAQHSKQVAMTPAQWPQDRVEPWQRLRVELLSGDGSTLAAGRDLDELRRRFVQATGVEMLKDEQWFRKDVRRWPVAEIPETVDVAQNDLTISACPALTDKDGKVTLRLFSDIDTAADEHRLGVARLALMSIADKVKYLQKNVPDANRLGLLYMQFGDINSLLDDAIFASIVERFLANPDAVPRNESQFAKLVGQLRAQIIAPVQELAIVLLDILTRRQALVARIDESKTALEPAVRKDIELQLEHLVYPGFVRLTPGEWLIQLPRYLAAIERRLERLAGRGSENAEQARTVAQFWQRFIAAASAGDTRHLTEFRWLLEEFRISCFAQPQKTLQRVSAARLEKVWQEALSQTG